MAYWVSKSSRWSEIVSGSFTDWDAKFPDAGIQAELAVVVSNGSRIMAPQELPSRLMLRRPYNFLPDAFRSDGGTLIVSKNVMDIISSLDEHSHQYWQLSVLNSKAIAFDETIRFGLNVHFTQETIVDDGSDVKPNMFSPEDNNQRFIMDHGPQTRLNVDRAKMGKANLWRERRYPGLLMLSDTLHEAFLTAGVDFFPHFHASEL